MNRPALVVTTWLLAFAAGCDSEPDRAADGGDAQPSEASDAAARGDADLADDAAPSCVSDAGPSACVELGDVNPDCLEKEPFDGACAQRDGCCRRSSNRTKEEGLCPDDPLVLDYRLHEAVHLAGGPFITVNGRTPTSYDRETLNILWRFELPRRDGEVVSGTGRMLFGYGRYNCDGTYSYYDDSIAPPREDCPTCSQDSVRWTPWVAMLHVDESQSGADRLRVQLPRDPQRSHLHAPLFRSDGVAVDETVFQGLELEPVDLEGEGRDCIGSWERYDWVGGARYITYLPLEPNARATILLIEQTHCQLHAFNVLPEGMKDKSCSTDRCLPDGGSLGDGGCDWERVPDSLCPVTDDEILAWDCHLGAAGNPNQEADYPAELSCTAARPTETLDPMVATETGQCCDPLGESDELPACNAWRLVGNYVAAAAAITREPASELPTDCGIRFRQGP